MAPELIAEPAAGAAGVPERGGHSELAVLIGGPADRACGIGRSPASGS